MTVCPNRLYGIGTYVCEFAKLKRSRTQGRLRTFVQFPHHIALSLAARAGAMAAQTFQGYVRFDAVIPLDGQFRSDQL